MEWKPELDELLLQEIIVSEPYMYKPFTRESGHMWEDIADRLNKNPEFKNKIKQKRAIRDHYNLLAKKFQRKIAEEKKASGISPELSELEKLLEEIIEKFEEGERESAEKNKKVLKEKAQAEEMRNKSMEKLGETMKRNAEEDLGQGTGDIIFLLFSNFCINNNNNNKEYLYSASWKSRCALQ